MEALQPPLAEEVTSRRAASRPPVHVHRVHHHCSTPRRRPLQQRRAHHNNIHIWPPPLDRNGHARPRRHLQQDNNNTRAHIPQSRADAEHSGFSATRSRAGWRRLGKKTAITWRQDAAQKPWSAHRIERWSHLRSASGRKPRRRWKVNVSQKYPFHPQSDHIRAKSPRHAAPKSARMQPHFDLPVQRLQAMAGSLRFGTPNVICPVEQRRWRLERATRSSSTSPIVPTPAAAR